MMDFQLDDSGRYVAHYGPIWVGVCQGLYQPGMWNIDLRWVSENIEWSYRSPFMYTLENAMIAAQELVPKLVKAMVDQGSKALLENASETNVGLSSWDRLLTETFPE